MDSTEKSSGYILTDFGKELFAAFPSGYWVGSVHDPIDICTGYRVGARYLCPSAWPEQKAIDQFYRRYGAATLGTDEHEK